MVPLAYVFLERFPLSANGKIDRRALPAPEVAPGAGEHAAPVTPTERAIALIWQAILAVPSVGRYDDFFELGGHSLLATQVASRVRHHFHVELPLRTLFEASRLNEFAARVDGSLASAGPSRAARIPRADRTQRIPLSYAQQRLWFLWRMDPESRVHNLTEAARWRGRFDGDAIRRAFDQIVQRHEVLRTRFREENGEPYQVIEPAQKLQVPTIDARDCAATKREELALELAEREAGVPFHLERDPLLRVKIVEFAADDHVVLVTAHHIVSDGWSMHLMVDEFAELYAAFTERRAPRLPELTVQYADYSVWQRQWLHSGELDRQLAYWKAMLGTEHPVLELPGDRTRPAVQSQRGATHQFEIEATLTRSLRELGRRNDVTLFTLCLAALQVLLWRYSGQTDVRVGVPVASRGQLEIESLIGFFVNTHVFRGDLAGDPSFEALLARLKEVTLGAQAHQDLPFERLVEALRPERSLGHNPLFQVLYNHVRPEHRGLEALPGVAISWLSRRVHATEVDLTINAVETGEAISVAMIYATDLFDREAIEQLARHFRQLLAAIVENPRQNIGRLPLLDVAERRELLEAGNATEFRYPEDRCLHELIAEQASRTPDRVAVIFGDEELRYAELEARATRLANRLRSFGVRPDVRVGIYLERSPSMLVSLLAVLKAGGAYVPLDPEYPSDRIAYMLEDARPGVVLTDTRVAARLPKTAASVWCLDADAADQAILEEATPSHGPRPDDLAYCIYTSGSTGRPKGVAISHRALVNCLYSMLDRPGLGQNDRMLGLTSLSFDIAALELYLPLLCGARVVLVERAIAADAEALLAQIERHGVTAVQATPSTWRMLTEAQGFERLRVARILCGGEALPVDLGRRLSSVTLTGEPGPRAQVWNVYGPTETTIWSARHELGPTGEPWLGQPLGNTQVHVLDGELNPVPAGVVGELYIGGQGLARGYWNRPELTAERFVPDPYSGPGARLYRTSDLGRRRRDGTLEYRGRADQQVKLRGHRIELGEIEARLLEHESVRQAAVIVREDVPADPRLVAYVAAEDGALTSASTDEQAAYRDVLHAWLRSVLPDYMLPRAYVLLNELPLTSNRKLDRKALPAPAGGELARQYVAPRNAIEQSVADVWREVLRVERVGIHDDFFELGGHSLLATQVLARVRQQLDVELGLRVLFEAHDLAGFSERVELALGAGERTPIAPLVPVERRERMPLSSAQERLWFLWRLEPESAAYNIPLALRLQGTLDRRALESAFEAVIERHEALRTEFRDEDGRPSAVIREPGRLRISTSDLRGEPEPERSARLRALMNEEAAAPLALDQGEVLRVRVFELAEREHVLQLTMHHIVSDGWSMNVLAEELSETYSARSEGRQPAFEPLAIQFVDYAVWQRAWLGSGELERQLEYWKATLGTEHPVLALPADHARPAVQSFHGATRSFVLPPALTRSLRVLARRHDATLFMVLLATFKLLLHRYSGQSEIRVGVPNANRTRAELERVVGVFVNLHVLRTEVLANASFGDLIEAVKQTALGAQAHPDLPFEELVQALNPARSLSHNPLVQVMYNHQTPGAASFRKELQQLRIEELEPETRTTQFDLTLTTLDEGEQLRAALTYSTDLFEAQTIDRLVGHFTNLLEAAVRSPGTSCGALPLLDQNERRELVETRNATRAEYPADRSLPELFEEQVGRSPDAPAVTFGDSELSYAELNAAANRIAWALRRRGVGPEVLVGIHLDRSPSMLAALLGILKAGGAYVPLDPDYPAERIAYMLRDARPALVLTEERLGARLPEGLASTWSLDRAGAELAQESTEDPPRAGHPEHLAYCLYTSGSTGAPKAVAISRRALVNFLWSMRERPGLARTDPVLALTSLSFDIAGLELYLPLIAGARVVLVDRATAVDPDALLAHIDAHGVTVVQATPATWRMLSQHPRFERTRKFRVLCGGEALEPDLALRLLAHAPEVWNLYGPTETTVWSTLAHVRGAEGPPPIGRPIANTGIYILDTELSPTPLGVPGELYISGAGLGRGYLGRPDLTAERFVPSPFHASGERLYRTGDRARHRPDGAIEYLGRADGQIKIRGYRVELGEIEARLRAHAGVREAAVSARRDGTSELQLVAYVAPDPELLRTHGADEQVTARRSLRAHLAAALPEYMMPNRYRFLNALPLTVSGKIDRKALAAESAGELESPHAPPRTELERRLAEIWQTVLGVERVGLADDFFELGGHSLLATQVIARIQKELRVSLPLRRLLEATTLERLALEVARAEPTRPSAEQLQRLDAIMAELEESQWT
jgi:amino acid adenylation domain-containing protein